jgi:hypothetical protein
MQLPSLSVLALATVAAFGDTASAATCIQTMLATHIVYTVVATEVSNGPGVCGGLWSNLRRFGLCSASETSCEADDRGRLVWKFTVTIGCNKGMVHSAWWEATQNKWGGISCY